ncbi:MULTISPECIES: N(2)-acetyl-L-2,4-diaminobutanoate deacetylase DoeB [unclassified Halomonas]|jgi:N-alpha-acetyl-L-2,4-diaminobutyrate deacetylase|uniref:N(2)-acetyl-L-2,4-diaminobutanoate deacetylase DoeB n=1 Tax=unclassified Halomonas TaxID=2609666 RepID=UPI0005F9F057|nr:MULTISPECIES: N(2)-acetyl-L-2,4-diaminobutanoate deacetylase DoeB [unclassified Halomonas]MBR9879595.1 N-alpha-acetyl diaminobutyric acid deacetylase DoeB [Gammaproteobacteria bacterium]KJZ16873.1 deacylase [Halomonas sp. S2151]MBY6110049.1 N(2)-acetyl-L-2,4-diaminobutanoate deacetylase DoeB [Halomonas sp. DP1Y21-3]MCJ8285774.1 N(2)-acetyl-L-2,4-diaminobutanoate deacetylase DoeB [Halomonas sp.]MCO7216352.1 N(2)-acetyl-L-2,4-diaminobutanoate deacetylase DoeB [Halomonas sp. OfavH-34-E]|tara:strand:+ start:2680 stop:3693 length:1014 start_codon:yes stop_codon:yes gene_type:complete
MSKRKSPISATVDFDAQGVQHGFLKLPISNDESAWGAVMIPVTVIANGEGPTALLTGGNHGDEYEGITALQKLSTSLKAEDVKGRVIIVPMMNTPAAQVGRRTSPMDGGNLNRSFPGDPDGSVTEKIADYFTREMVPMADVVLDLHSGGRTLDIIPFGASHVLDNPEQQRQALEGAKAFGAPYAMMMFELDAAALFDTVVENQGKIFIATELGGGGTSTPESLAITERGIDNVLIHFGLKDGEVAMPETQVYLDMPDASCYVQSEHTGLLELTYALGDSIAKGDVIARVYDMTRSGAEPIEYRAERDGILAARRFPAQVNMGDTIAVIAEVVETLGD